MISEKCLWSKIDTSPDCPEDKRVTNCTFDDNHTGPHSYEVVQEIQVGISDKIEFKESL